MTPNVVFLGGNGHSASRLSLAIPALSGVPENLTFHLVSIAYPGFESAPRSVSLDDFLATLSREITSHAPSLLYATGIGGLIGLCLRARGHLVDLPFLLQAPVLWGLEHRLMPRFLRLGLARVVLGRLFSRAFFRRWFSRQFFVKPPDPGLLAAFFKGYEDCPAAADFFAWFTPALLRRLESDFRVHPSWMANIRVWWGERDRVVTTKELTWTEQALGVAWPLRSFPEWGHYPMIDDPEGWVRALVDELASTRTLP